MSIALRADASRAVVVLDGVDRVAFNEDGSMELLTPTANPTGNKVMTVSQMPFSKVYESPEQTMTTAMTTVHDLTHDLGMVPVLVQYWYVCKVAAAGYAVGEIIYPTTAYDSNSTGTASGWCTSVTNTKLYVRQTINPLLIVDRVTGGLVTYATLAANFKLIVRAWA